MRFVSAIAIGAFALFAIPSATSEGVAQAQSASGFQNYMMEVRKKALSEGVSARTLDRVLPGLTYNERVVRFDRSQPGGAPNTAIPPYAPYRRKHVTQIRISQGKKAYNRLASKLMQIERDTGVPPGIIMSIYGKESNYGSFTGNFDVPRALASLAYEGRRRSLFEGELIAALKMIDNGVSQAAMTGSWAGAMGKPQFLPSVYLRLAKDGNGDGYADIWNSEHDAMASIANYFVNAGWRRGETWGVAVNVPNGLNRAAIKNKTKATRCPRVHERHSQWKTMSEWRALGVQPATWRKLGDDTLATLLEPDGPGNRAYLLTSNYRVILDYNCSNFYGLTVGLLADEIRS